MTPSEKNAILARAKRIEARLDDLEKAYDFNERWQNRIKALEESAEEPKPKATPKPKAKAKTKKKAKK